MFGQIVEATKLSPDFCADVLRVPVEQFRAWMNGTEPLPAFVTPELTALLGVPEKELRARKTHYSTESGGAAPAVWFKLRDERLTQWDREMVGLVRRLGFSMKQLDEIEGTRSASMWQALSREIVSESDLASPPTRQGAEAALRFRSITGLDSGQTGIGEVVRPALRAKGLIVIESPIPKSRLDGCCFDVGDPSDRRACVFANSFKSTWFKRNEVLLHEVCHAIFDIRHEPVALDFDDDQQEPTPAIAEARARAFARECLAPASVLKNYSSRHGVKWDSLTPPQLAQLVAEVHVEKATLLSSAHENGLIDT